LWLLVVAVIVYFSVGLGTDFVVSRISFAAEAKLFGTLSFAQSPDAQKAPCLGRVRRVLSVLSSDPAVPPLPYRLVLIEERRPNAFAFPGGMIGVSSGLLEALPEEIGLAFVLGHELGHFQYRDHLRGLGRAVGAGLGFSLLLGGRMGGDSVAKMLHFVLQRGYSRHREEAADRFGVALVYRVYGKTEGVDRLFTLLSGRDKAPAWAYMFATHPSPSRRIEKLKAYAAELAGRR